MIRQLDNVFVLDTKHTTYCFQVLESGHLEHLYYGKRLSEENLSWMFEKMHCSFSPCYMEWKEISLNVIPHRIALRI